MKKKQNKPNNSLYFQCKQCGKNNITSIIKDSEGKTTVISACTCKKSKNGFVTEKFTLKSSSLKKHLKALSNLDIQWGFDGKLQWRTYDYESLGYKCYARCYINGCFIEYGICETWGNRNPDDSEPFIRAEVVVSEHLTYFLRNTENDSCYFDNISSAKRACQEHLEKIKVTDDISDTFTEWCPECEGEVTLNSVHIPQTCPNCKHEILPCALCDMDVVKCSECWVKGFFTT